MVSDFLHLITPRYLSVSPVLMLARTGRFSLAKITTTNFEKGEWEATGAGQGAAQGADEQATRRARDGEMNGNIHANECASSSKACSG
jgi:hypothetical protein